MSCAQFINEKGFISSKANLELIKYGTLSCIPSVIKGDTKITSINISQITDTIQYCIDRLTMMMIAEKHKMLSITTSSHITFCHSILYILDAYILSYLNYQIYVKKNSKYMKDINKIFSVLLFIGRKFQTKNYKFVRGYFLFRYINHGIPAELEQKISKYIKYAKSSKQHYINRYNAIKKVDNFKDFNKKLAETDILATKLCDKIRNSNEFKAFTKTHPVKEFEFNVYKFIKKHNLDTPTLRIRLKQIENSL